MLRPGSPEKYANRAYLRGLVLRWDPATLRRHGTTTIDRVRELRERLGPEVRCFATLEPRRGPSPPRPPTPTATPVRAVTSTRDPASRSCDGSRTHAEARTVYGADEENGVANSRFTAREITSGLPDDSKEADERFAARRLRDSRGRVRAARAAISATLGAERTLHLDWVKAAHFYARFGIPEGTFLHGVPGSEASDDGPLSLTQTFSDDLEELRAREVASLPRRHVLTCYLGVVHDLRRAGLTG